MPEAERSATYLHERCTKVLAIIREAKERSLFGRTTRRPALYNEGEFTVAGIIASPHAWEKGDL